MYKKKEIFTIISIVSITLLLAFMPTIVEKNKKSKVVNEEESSIINDKIKIRVEGEIFYNDGFKYLDYYENEFPIGSSYGYIIQKINVYLTNYKKLDFDSYTKRYFESSTIVIDTYDTGFDVEEVFETESYKININTASKYELMTIYGIGEKRSDTIIEYRNNKKIEDFYELQKLIGVSDEVIERIKEKAVCQ